MFSEYYFQPPSFLTLAPIICAATALRFETYRTWAARVLEQTWSSSLEDLTPEPKEDAAGVIVLARSCGLNSVVKRALYELARTRRISLHDDDVLGQSVLPQIGRADERCVGLMKELLVTTWSEVAVRIDTFPCRDKPFSNKIRRVSLAERGTVSLLRGYSTPLNVYLFHLRQTGTIQTSVHLKPPSRLPGTNVYMTLGCTQNSCSTQCVVLRN